MSCSKHISFCLWAAILFALVPLANLAGQSQIPNQQPGSTVNLRWGARPGVSRYRLQLAQDVSFSDIVFDRVVTGNQTQVNDLAPGKYFWRIAPLTTRLGEFSSAGVVEVVASGLRPATSPTPGPTATKEISNSIKAGGGWRAVVGEVSTPVLAHLRRSDAYDLVVVSDAGLVSAFDATSGVALWTSNALQKQRATRSAEHEPVTIRSRSSVDDVLIVSGPSLLRLDGMTGRELWRTELPIFISSVVPVEDQRSSSILVTDASLQRLFILNEGDGRTVAQVKLPGRIVAKPVALNRLGQRTFALAYENGQIEIRNSAGELNRSGSAQSQIVTPPIFVRRRSGDLVLVGTRDGLTAMTADTLRPLGRVSLPDDLPRGLLAAHDLDGDGVPEVLMTTKRGYVVAVKTDNGKIFWESTTRNESDALAFADLDRDGFVDVITHDGARMVALSGRDGSVVWKDAEASIANHTTSFTSRAPIALTSASSPMIVVSAPGGGLRAITFSHSAIRPAGK